MGIQYEPAADITILVRELATALFAHVQLDSVSCIRSFGSSSRRTVARCHALGKAMQLGMGRKKGFYVIEVLSKRFDKLSHEEKIKVLIHELMHIPKSFGGGFRHHDYVCEENIDKEYRRYLSLKHARQYAHTPVLTDNLTHDEIITPSTYETKKRNWWF